MKNVFKRIAGGALALTLLTGAVAANAPVISSCITYAASESIENAISKSIPYVAHVQTYGWQETIYADGNPLNFNGEKCPDVYIGTTNQAKRLEAFVIGDPDLHYCVKYAGKNIYEDWVDGAQPCSIRGYNFDLSRIRDYPFGHIAGSTGQAKAIQAIKIDLKAKNSGYDIFYRVHIQGKGWLNWTKNGGEAGNGYGARLEAIQIKKVERNKYYAPTIIPGNGAQYAYYYSVNNPKTK